MKHLLAILFLLALPAHAEPTLGNDYSAIFALNADRVEVLENGDRRLTLPPGIVITKHGGADNPTYSASDTTEHGAVGCIILVIRDIEAIDRACPDILDAPSKLRLEEIQIRLLNFYAANVFQPIERGIVEELYRESVQSRNQTAQGCELAPDTLRLVRSVTDETSVKWVDLVLSVPRLPVSNPCF